MSIAVLFLWQLADITSSMWQLHGRNDNLILIPILSSSLTEQTYRMVHWSTSNEGRNILFDTEDLQL